MPRYAPRAFRPGTSEPRTSHSRPYGGRHLGATAQRSPRSNFEAQEPTVAAIQRSDPSQLADGALNATERPSGDHAASRIAGRASAVSRSGEPPRTSMAYSATPPASWRTKDMRVPSSENSGTPSSSGPP